jgi:hypothetical protein
MSAQGKLRGLCRSSDSCTWTWRRRYAQAGGVHGARHVQERDERAAGLCGAEITGHVCRGRWRWLCRDEARLFTARGAPDERSVKLVRGVPRPASDRGHVVIGHASHGTQGGGRGQRAIRRGVVRDLPAGLLQDLLPAREAAQRLPPRLPRLLARPLRRRGHGDSRAVCRVRASVRCVFTVVTESPLMAVAVVCCRTQDMHAMPQRLAVGQASWRRHCAAVPDMQSADDALAHLRAARGAGVSGGAPAASPV